MKKYLKHLSFVPITLIMMFFLSENELKDHTKLQSVMLLLTFLIFIITYILLIWKKFNKYVVIGLAIIFWIISIIAKNLFLV